MKLRKMHWVGIIAAAIIALVAVIFFPNEERMLFFLIGLGIGILVLPFVLGVTLENKKEQRYNEMFLEFTRNLAESVAAGTPVSKSIVNMKRKNYGVLTLSVEKLSNQIELGIPVERALQTFANDVNSPVIKRAVSLIREANKAGGEIDYILDSTAKSISEIDKLKKERKSAIYNLIVQGYVIFFIFIGIILVIEFKIVPLTAGIGDFTGFTGSVGDFGKSINGGGEIPSDMFTKPFLYLLLVQGFFIGLTIGKLSEGSLKSGIKHSFIMMIAAFLISTGSNLFLISN